MAVKDISNQKLWGLISAETIASAVTLIIVGAMALQALASEQESQKTDLHEIKAQQKKFIEDFETVNEKLQTLSVGQGKISERQKATVENYKEVKADLRYIREILDKAYK